jgi:hypothetical protein
MLHVQDWLPKEAPSTLALQLDSPDNQSLFDEEDGLRNAARTDESNSAAAEALWRPKIGAELSSFVKPCLGEHADVDLPLFLPIPKFEPLLGGTDNKDRVEHQVRPAINAASACTSQFAFPRTCTP